MNIQLFSELFKGRTDVYGTDNQCVRKPLTDQILLQHLQGKKRIGVYPLIRDKCNFIVIDIDVDDLKQAQSYHKESLKVGLPCFIENSKQKGYHCWHFFDSPVLAKNARAVVKFIFLKISQTYEIFPKQDSAPDVGNYINLPLFNEGKNNRTIFLDPLNGCTPIDDQWRFLAGLEKISQSKIDDLIEKSKIKSERKYTPTTIPDLSYENTDLMIRTFINMAVNKAGAEGRNNAGLDLANQLRDHNLSEHEAKDVMLRYNSLVSSMKDHPYSQQEALNSLRSSYRGQKRESWWKPNGNNDSKDSKTEKPTENIPDPMSDFAEPDINIKTFNKTDYGNAERLVHYYGSIIRFCHQMKSWFIWDEKRWKQDTNAHIHRMAKDTVRKIYIEGAHIDREKSRDDMIKHAKASEASNKIQAMVTVAQSELEVSVEADQLDSNLWILNCLNGKIDLKTGELLPHDKNDLITKIVPVNYDPSAKLELWDKFLDTATGGNEELISFLQYAVGYSLTGDISEEKLFFIYGPAGSGKSTFIEAIKVCLSEYSKTADFETFISHTFAGGTRNDIAALAGARFVSSIEVDEGKKLAEGLIKLVTGGDTVTARFLYQELFSFLPQFKLWLVANHKPIINPEDDGMWRRIIPINFDNAIPEEDRDPMVKATLKNPEIAGSAILAWAVQGCLRWQEYGLKIPQSIKSNRDEYKNDMDSVKQFVDECCELELNEVVTKQMLFSQYQQWCKDSGIEYLTKIIFGRRLKNAFPTITDDEGTKHIKLWSGIKISAFATVENENYPEGNLYK